MKHLVCEKEGGERIMTAHRTLIVHSFPTERGECDEAVLDNLLGYLFCLSV